MFNKTRCQDHWHNRFKRSTGIQLCANQPKSPSPRAIPATLVLGGCLLASLSAQAAIIVTDAFRYIRTDSHAEAGGLIDYGQYTISGATYPAGGTDALGLFQSTIENTASVTNGGNSATGRAYVQVDSLLEATDNALTLDVTAHLETEADIAGDGQIYGEPFSNSTRTFSFINQYVNFTLDQDYLYSMTGVSIVALYNYTAGEFGSELSGTLSAGDYRFQVSDSIEYTSLPPGNTFREKDIEVLFTLNEAPTQETNQSAVPAPGSLPLMLGTGLLVASGGARRRWHQK